MASNTDQNESEPLYDQPYTGAPSQAVVTAMACVTDQSRLELAVLAETIDPDSLNTLLTRKTDVAQEPTVRFRYAGHRVTISTEALQIDQTE